MKRIILLVSMLAMTAMLAAPPWPKARSNGARARQLDLLFLGLNDDPLEGGRVQSYGQIVKAGGKAFAPSPGTLCNGHLFPYPEAFGEETP